MAADRRTCSRRARACPEWRGVRRVPLRAGERRPDPSGHQGRRRGCLGDDPSRGDRGGAGPRPFDLDRELVVFVEGERFTTTPRRLGRRAWVGQAVDEAMKASERFGWVERAWRRFRDDPVRVDVELTLEGDRGVEGFVRRTARKVSVHPRNASIGIGKDGALAFRRSKPGAALDVHRAERLLSTALGDGSSIVRFSVHPVAAKINPRTIGPTIVVHVDTNRLDLYEGFQVAHSWDVATAKPGYVTPVGEWTLYQKRENPTWYNPALDSWGAGSAGGGSRWTRQPDGHAGPLHHGARPDQDPRDDVPRFDRSLRLPRLHPDAQRAGRGALRPRSGGDEGHHRRLPALVGVGRKLPGHARRLQHTLA